MEINRQVFEILRTLDGDSKEKAEKAIAHLEEVSTHLGKLEANELEANAIKEELGDNKLADLITKSQFVDSNGGVDKIAEWKGDDEVAKAEIERLKADNLKNQEANNQKTADLQAKLESANLHSKVVSSIAGKYSDVDDIIALSGGDFADVDGTLTYKGKILDGEGGELLAERHKKYLISPDSGGAETPAGNPPRQNERKNKKIVFHD